MAVQQCVDLGERRTLQRFGVACRLVSGVFRIFALVVMLDDRRELSLRRRLKLCYSQKQ